MGVRLAFVPTRRPSRALVGFLTSMVAIAVGAAAFAQAPSAAQPNAAEPQQFQVSYSPWMKFCFNAHETQGQLGCFTGMDGKLQSGVRAVAAVLIEREGEAKKLLRLILPLGAQLPPGTRVIIDQAQPMSAPYIICLNKGCIADYEASEELIADMKRGQRLVVQAINGQGQATSLALPLNDFGKAYDGPPSDLTGFEVQPNKEQDELRKSIP